jgi:hypothetical protein
MNTPRIQAVPVAVSEPQVVALLDTLTSELAGEGYTAEQTFGYTADQLQLANVYMVGARVDGKLVGIGGLELQERGAGELKRFFVSPSTADMASLRSRASVPTWRVKPQCACSGWLETEGHSWGCGRRSGEIARWLRAR